MKQLSILLILLAGTCLGDVLTVTPEEHGAAGDGVSDDTSAISSAISSCAGVVAAAYGDGCRVVFANSYLSGPIVVGSGVTLEVTGRLGMLPKAEYCQRVGGCRKVGGGGTPFITNEVGECRDVSTTAGDYEVCADDIKITGGGVIRGSPDPWGE